MILIFFSDCPNTFVPINNKCYKMMTDDLWSNQYKNCWMSRGVLLTIHDDAIGEMIAKKLMTYHDLGSIFLGVQRNFVGTKWQSDWYSNSDLEFGIPDDEITTFIKNHVMIATLESDTFSFASADGYRKEPAICEFGNFKFHQTRV